MYNDKRVSVIIVAAGSGTRMKENSDKQYLPLEGKPVLAMSIGAFDENALIDHIYVVVKTGEEKRCEREIVEPWGFKKVRSVCGGGRERTDSVLRGLEQAEGSCEIILVHDGARPLVTEQIIKNVIYTAERHKAAIPVVSTKDTIKVIDGQGMVISTPDRSSLVAVQTPQGFDYKLLKRCYDEMRQAATTSEDSPLFSGITDDGGLLERCGYAVYTTPGEFENIKITTDEDLGIALSILKRRNFT